MLKTFIERPVLSTVISIIIVVLGIIGLYMLPIEQYPNIAPPTVRVSTAYSGANADAVLNSVIVPLEEQINGVQGMTYMTSTASNGGGASINVYFKQGTDPDMAAVNVQNRVSQAASLLPAEVTRSGVVVQKQQSSNIMMIVIKSDNPDYDAKFLQNYANINIVPQLKRIDGVGSAGSFGTQEYSMRVWLKPDVMKAYNLTPAEVTAALQDQNIDAAPGQLGAQGNQSFQYALRYTGRLKNADEFGNIIIRSKSAQTLRLKDVARIELGVQDYNFKTLSGNKPSILLAISQVAGSNAQDIIEQVKAEMKKVGKELPPGVTYDYMMDASEFLNASIKKVLHTLLEAFVLVFLVVLLFLENFRATLIPAIAVPVAIIGTFFFLLIFGFSINLLTLFALVLAIGIVVDDAIVVVEAIHAKLDAGEKDARTAAIKAMGEIAPAIVSITLVMAAVFIPVSFLGGTSGVFFKQFGLTLAMAIIISAINALTLSPALCALFLKPEEHTELAQKSLPKKFAYYFGVGFEAATQKYKKALYFLTKKKHRWITAAIVVVFALIFFSLMKIMPTGFVPQEDSGTLMGSVTLSPGSSFERTDSVVKNVVKTAEALPGVKSVTSLTGFSFMGGSGSSYGGIVLKMNPWEDRDITTNQAAAILKEKTASATDAKLMFFAAPTLQGFGLSNGVALEMQDKTGGDINKFFDVVTNYLNQLQKRPEVMMAMTTFDPRFPQKMLEANVAKIKDAGLNLSDVMSTLQTYIGSMYISNFNTYGKQYRVVVQAAPQYRSKLEDLSGLSVRTSNGTMAPITEFLTIKDVTGPQSLSRFNLFSSMSVTVIPNYAKGFTSGDAIKAIQETPLPEGYTYDYSGMTREEVNSSNQTILVFILSLVFVYLLLSALYESYILPLAVIFSLPVGLAGVFIFIFSAMMGGTGIVNNIYVQISLIMLIGLLSKNAILIVEYALQRRQKGMSITKAAISGALARLRPILMTSFAMIFGLMPLALAVGAGAVGNKSIGISAIGGMFVGTMIGIFVIPVLFILFQTLHERLSKHKIVTIDDSEI
ncbi:efflux RND transporter permease subunit [Paludibacter sp.]|uniref:efflux RND transporter permease subunit n=1 Tax=Paludibacter sp. TaxID=1898105 RepID=UPI0013538C22|nr:efflux RND transporter permease subunit [Paludibacter sp.]MTK52988.1 efflux RND transporter permease subunit [Paludibacter sp.]